MTETEAKTKWCPMVMRQTRNPAEQEACKGSGCMMWRATWRHESRDFAGKDIEKERVKIAAKGGVITALDPYDPSGDVAFPTGHGFCGLAGKP